MTTDIVIAEPTMDRAEIVLQQIKQIRDGMATGFLVLARLLKEARDNDYPQRWGYARFGQWVEEGSGLDISERTAYDLIRVVTRSEELGIPDDQLTKVKISNLKSIFSLPEDTDPDVMRELVVEAKSLPVKKVREVVGEMKNEDYVYHTLKILRETEDNLYQPALERVRREYGNTVGPEGNPEDISDSRGTEMIFADYLASPEEEDDLPIVEAEWTDVTDSGTEETETNQAVIDEVSAPVQGSPDAG